MVLFSFFLSNVVKNKNGTTSTTYTIHVTGKVLDANGGSTDQIAKGINDKFNSNKTEYTDKKGNSFTYNFDVQYEGATSMSSVSASDNLLVVVNDVNGKADPAMGSRGGSQARRLVSRRRCRRRRGQNRNIARQRFQNARDASVIGAKIVSPL